MLFKTVLFKKEISLLSLKKLRQTLLKIVVPPPPAPPLCVAAELGVNQWFCSIGGTHETRGSIGWDSKLQEIHVPSHKKNLEKKSLMNDSP